MKISGVYKITNHITGDFYIGSSKDIKRRWATHKSPSRWKKQPNAKLYQAFIKYGLDNFIFEIIEETTDLHNREQYYIECLKPNYNNYRAQGFDIERIKETSKRCNKEWYKAHLNEKLTKMKDYYYTHRDEHLAKTNIYRNKLCLYNGETLTLHALSTRFRRHGISQPTLEAKKYLIERSINDESL